MSDFPLPPCPTPCDPDCDAECHEEHLLLWKRGHQPHGCHEIRVAIAGWVTVERERIRQRLVSCPACGEIHAEYHPEGYYDHPNKAPWRAAGPNALAFLDELLGDGPIP